MDTVELIKKFKAMSEEERIEWLNNGATTDEIDAMHDEGGYDFQIVNNEITSYHIEDMTQHLLLMAGAE